MFVYSVLQTFTSSSFGVSCLFTSSLCVGVLINKYGSRFSLFISVVCTENKTKEIIQKKKSNPSRYKSSMCVLMLVEIEKRVNSKREKV